MLEHLIYRVKTFLDHVSEWVFNILQVILLFDNDRISFWVEEDLFIWWNFQFNHLLHLLHLTVNDCLNITHYPLWNRFSNLYPNYLLFIRFHYISLILYFSDTRRKKLNFWRKETEKLLLTTTAATTPAILLWFAL